LRLRNYGRLVPCTARGIGATLDRQEGVMKSAFGIIGFDHHEAAGR
jgi:hypothetical protein